jgi:hypothetical protein
MEDGSRREPAVEAEYSKTVKNKSRRCKTTGASGHQEGETGKARGEDEVANQ